jgi:hypothetical protein
MGCFLEAQFEWLIEADFLSLDGSSRFRLFGDPMNRGQPHEQKIFLNLASCGAGHFGEIFCLRMTSAILGYLEARCTDGDADPFVT